MSSEISKSILESLALGRLAPSSHNTQPWEVRLSDNEVIIGYNPTRQLKVGDPDKRELFISLGCFVETIVLAAQSKGLAVNYRYLGTNPEAVAALTFQATTPRDQDWIEYIKLRRSDRRFYQAKKIAAPDLIRLSSLKNSGASLIMLSESADIEFLAQLTKAATQAVMSAQDFRNELAAWVRHNWTKRPDGMPGYTQGMPGPVSLLAKFVIRKNKAVAKTQAKKDSRRVAHSAAIGLICINSDKPENWLAAGRLYQTACLTALKAGVKTSATSAAVILEPTRRQIIQKFSLSQPPVALLRFGYAQGTPRATPRRNVDQFVSPAVPSTD